MNKFSVVFLLFIFAFGISTARAQRCKGRIQFSLVDKKGKPLLNDQLEIKELDGGGEQTRIYFDRDNPTENRTNFDLGCDSGGSVSIIYQKAEMRVRFKFYMEVYAVGEIAFQTGDFVAEPVNLKAAKANKIGIRLRKANDDELK